MDSNMVTHSSFSVVKACAQNICDVNSYGTFYNIFFMF